MFVRHETIRTFPPLFKSNDSGAILNWIVMKADTTRESPAFARLLALDDDSMKCREGKDESRDWTSHKRHRDRAPRLSWNNNFATSCCSRVERLLLPSAHHIVLMPIRRGNDDDDDERKIEKFHWNVNRWMCNLLSFEWGDFCWKSRKGSNNKSERSPQLDLHGSHWSAREGREQWTY